MYACNQCHRSYASQNSLTRHVHSHETSKKHQCSVCGVIFYRKDLLSRHSKLHGASQEGSIQPSSPSVIDHLGAGGGRRRCHTACLRCRDLRTKCDGQRPCYTCQGAGHTCTFPPLTHRLSHVPTDMEEPVVLDSAPLSTNLQQQGIQPQLELEDVSNVLSNYDFEGSEAFMVGMGAWPWMHESLYLPADNSIFASLANSMDLGSTRTNTNDLLASPGTNLDAFPIASTIEPGQSLPTVVTDSTHQVIQDLVSYATMSDAPNRTWKACAEFWVSMSSRIAKAFSMTGELADSNQSILHRFGSSYVEHFGTLWPLLSPQTLVLDKLHPQLFLVLTSIGAMYCGPTASKYGVMMHTKIRGSLTSALDLEDEDTDLTWLAQARLLTQVAALYFGQPRAFTYAQHIGSLLVAQARKMDLFSGKHMENARKRFDHMGGTASERDQLAFWLQMEARRRLAFGIFRGDTYTSVLLHTKPLISLEEIDLQFPMCDAVWRGEKMTAGLCLQMIVNDQTLGRDLRASDIYHIALDRNESLPPLDPFGHELLIFGLQYPIWRFSRDQNMFERLIGHDNDNEENTERNTYSKRRRLSRSTFEHETHHLDSSVRQMDDLRLELKRLKSALEKWERALPVVKTFARTSLERSSLMSGLILYHLGFLRLDAPLEHLHQIQYRLADQRAVDNELTVPVRQWTNSARGRRASRRACSIWSMISREAQLPAERSIKFNLLAYVGLHHASVLLWAYAEGHDAASNEVNEDEPLTLGSPGNIVINKAHSSSLLGSFVQLYDNISSGRWSSFAQATGALAGHSLP